MDGIVDRVKLSRVEHGSLKSRWRDMLPLGAAGAQSAALMDPVHASLDLTAR